MRLTLAFTGVMALVLLVAGFFLARQFERDLDRSIAESQRAQAEDIAALVEGDRGARAVLDSGERYAQVYTADATCSPPPVPCTGAGCSTPTSCSGPPNGR